jgi:hypothetical protein
MQSLPEAHTPLSHLKCVIVYDTVTNCTKKINCRITEYFFAGNKTGKVHSISQIDMYSLRPQYLMIIISKITQCA